MSDRTGKFFEAGRRSGSREISPTCSHALDLTKIADLPSPTSIRSTSKSFASYSPPKIRFKSKSVAAKRVANASKDECLLTPQLSLPLKKRMLSQWIDLPEVTSVVATKKSPKATKQASGKAPSSKAGSSKETSSKAISGEAGSSKEAFSKAIFGKAGSSKEASGKATSSKEASSKATSGKAASSKEAFGKATSNKEASSKATSGKAGSSKEAFGKAVSSTEASSKATPGKAGSSKEASGNETSCRQASAIPSTSSSTKADAKKKPKASEASSSSPTTADDTMLSSSSSDSKFPMLSSILESDFESVEFTKLLRQQKFNEEQVNSIQKAFSRLCDLYVKPTPSCVKGMKTFKCSECYFRISHECVELNAEHYWPYTDKSPAIEYVAPETREMCECNFSIYHSHIKLYESTNIDKDSCDKPARSLTVNYHALQMDCPKCCMKIVVMNRKPNICSEYSNSIGSKEPLRKKFYSYICDNVIFKNNKQPHSSNIWCCRNFCCMIYHSCNMDVLRLNVVPIQPHKPLSLFSERESLNE